MIEVALEDGVAGHDATTLHSFVDPPRHLEHSMLVASIDDHVEDVSVEQTQRLRLALADHLEKLVRPKELLLLLLLPQGPAPHQDPAQVHIDPLIFLAGFELFELG